MSTMIIVIVVIRNKTTMKMIIVDSDRRGIAPAQLAAELNLHVKRCVHVHLRSVGAAADRPPEQNLTQASGLTSARHFARGCTPQHGK